MKEKTLIAVFLILTFCVNFSYSRNFYVYDTELNTFPTIKSKFYAFDNNNQILDLTPEDFTVRENGKLMNVLDVLCPAPQPPIPLSSVLTIDISGSMFTKNLSVAQEAAKEWVDMMFLGKSECAITSFNTNNYLNQDFTIIEEKLLNAINRLKAGGGTNINAGLNGPMAGSLLIAERGIHKRVIVFLTDGHAPVDQESIIQRANLINATIYSVVLGTGCPPELKEISERTGGLWFDKIHSAEEARTVYRQILLTAQNSDPCIVEWQSDRNCDVERREVAVYLRKYGLRDTVDYVYNWDLTSRISFKPKAVFFKNKPIGEKTDTTITITAYNDTFEITNIISSNDIISVTPSSFKLNSGESIDLTLSCTPKEKKYEYCKLIFENELCPADYKVAVYNKGGSEPGKLKVLLPDGGEKLVIGRDTVINWEGVLPIENILLELSRDNGQTWEIITNKASDLNYSWTKIPGPASDSCLVRASMNKIDPPTILWAKNYGGKGLDLAVDILTTTDGGYLLAGNINSEDGDISESKGNEDIWLAKLNYKGDIEWERSYGGSKKDFLHSIIQPDDGGYVMFAKTYSNDGDVDVKDSGYPNEAWWILKIDDNGNIQWKSYIKTNYSSYPGEIIQTNDGSYLVCGSAGDITLIKIDKTGNKLWQKNYGGRNKDYGISLVENINGEIIILGQTLSSDGDVSYNYGKSDVWVLKVDSYGKLIWQKNYGGSLSDIPIQMIKTFDQNYIFIAATESYDHDLVVNHGKKDMWIVQIDDNGNIITDDIYGGGAHDTPESIKRTNDGGYIIAGGTASENGDIITGNKGDYDC